MHGPINVKSPNNISKWNMGFNSAFKELKYSNGKAVKYSSIRIVRYTVILGTAFRICLRCKVHQKED
jgi:hypothetical protein